MRHDDDALPIEKLGSQEQSPMMRANNVTVTTPRRPLPDSVVEQLAELWCEALLANLLRHPVEPSLKRAS
jgi:hypothetical protein